MLNQVLLRRNINIFGQLGVFMNLNILSWAAAGLSAVIGIAAVVYSLGASLNGDLTAFAYLPIGALFILLGLMAPLFVDKN